MEREEQIFISQRFLQMASKLSPLRNAPTILDLGCGEGSLVGAFRQKGYDAYGCDYIDNKGSSDFTRDVQNRFDAGVLRAIEVSRYCLPFEDNTFDYIFSMQVFEHVMDYDATLREIRRILKPEGLSLHIFPSRYTLIEPHVFVPLATVFRNKAWLLLWAYMGVRNKHQRGKNAKEVAALNYDYLVAHTNYLRREQILNFARKYFVASFREDVFVKAGTSRKAQFFASIGKLFPLLHLLLSEFYFRVLALKK